MIANFHAEAVKRIRGAKITACFDAFTAGSERWQQEIGQGALPAEIPTKVVLHSELEARRPIAQGAAYLGEDKTRIDSHDQMIDVTQGLLDLGRSQPE